MSVLHLSDSSNISVEEEKNELGHVQIIVSRDLE